jgi:hypothetical protein
VDDSLPFGTVRTAVLSHVLLQDGYSIVSSSAVLQTVIPTVGFFLFEEFRLLSLCRIPQHGLAFSLSATGSSASTSMRASDGGCPRTVKIRSRWPQKQSLKNCACGPSMTIPGAYEPKICLAPPPEVFRKAFCDGIGMIILVRCLRLDWAYGPKPFDCHDC